MSIPNTAFSASSQPCISNRPVAATQGDAQHSRQAEPSVVAAAALQPQQGSQILEVDDGRHQDQRQQRQQQHRDAVIAAVAAAATASTSPEKSPNKAAARPLDATSGAMADIEHVMGGHVQECRHTYKDAVLFGRRCQALSKVCFFDCKDSIFHKEPKAWRVPCRFVQNTKLGFYVMQGENLKEFFYDSFEGWYIESRYQGNRMSYTCEASARYKQCAEGLRLNQAAYETALSDGQALLQQFGDAKLVLDRSFRTAAGGAVGL